MRSVLANGQRLRFVPSNAGVYSCVGHCHRPEAFAEYDDDIDILFHLSFGIITERSLCTSKYIDKHDSHLRVQDFRSPDPYPQSKSRSRSRIQDPESRIQIEKQRGRRMYVHIRNLRFTFVSKANTVHAE